MNNEPLNTQEIIGIGVSVALLGLHVHNVIKTRREMKKTEERIISFERIDEMLNEKFGTRLNQK